MKKIFLTVILSTIICTPVWSLNVEVEALSDFSTDNPPKVYTVKTVEPFVTKKVRVEAGSIIEGKIITKDAQRLKRDATFSFVPTKLITPEGNVLKVKRDYVGKYQKQVDKKKIAETVALTAGDFVIKGFSSGVTALEGAVKNEQGNRLKSTAVALYEKSPVSYIQKGEALELKQGERFYINFKNNDDDGNNYNQ